MEIAAEVVFLAETNTFVSAINSAKRLGIKFSEALKMVEAEDDQPLKFDAFDDPFVSRDTLVGKEERGQFSRAAISQVPHRSQRAPAGSQITGLLALFLMLIRSKWLWTIGLVVVGYRFIWPWLQSLR